LAGHVAHIGKNRNAFRVSVAKLEGRPRHSWEDDIKMGLKEIG
jgi:hypothetical protein